MKAWQWMHKPGLLAASLVALGMTLSGAAPAQTFPAKPVRLINPFAVGGTAEPLSRHLAAALPSTGIGCLVEQELADQVLQHNGRLR